MNIGWIRVYRKLMDKWYYKDSEYVHLWVHLLLRVAHEKREYIKWGKKVIEERGEICISLLDLERETKINDNKIRRVLDTLLSEEQIGEQKVGRKYSRIKVINYDIYQSEEHIGDKMGNRRGTDGEQTGEQTNKNDNNEKNEKKLYKRKSRDNYPQLPEIDEETRKRNLIRLEEIRRNVIG